MCWRVEGRGCVGRGKERKKFALNVDKTLSRPKAAKNKACDSGSQHYLKRITFGEKIKA